MGKPIQRLPHSTTVRALLVMEGCRNDYYHVCVTWGRLLRGAFVLIISLDIIEN